MILQEVLNKPYQIKREISSLEGIKAQSEILANSIPGGNYDEPRVQKSHSTKAPFIRWIDKIIAIEKKIDEKYEELNKYEKIIMEAVDSLSDLNQKKIVIARFLSCKTWSMICKEFYISITTAKRWRYEALKNIENSVHKKLIWTGVDLL